MFDAFYAAFLKSANSANARFALPLPRLVGKCLTLGIVSGQLPTHTTPQAFYCVDFDGSHYRKGQKVS